MPRNGSGVYSLPAGSTVSNGDVSDASDLNTPLADIEADANTPRPVVAGGTGASSASGALVNLGLTATAAEINVLDGITATTAELNLLDGATVTTAEINALDGVTATGTALIVAADAAAARTAIGAQAADATLTSLSGISLAAGDLLYATGADTLVRLAKGTAGQALTMNSGATAPEWVTPFWLGVGQTWQNVLASRTHSTSYQNTTGRPIFVALNGDNGRNVEVSPDNTNWFPVGVFSNTSSNGVQVVVPVGHYYRVNGSSTLSFWTELR